MPAQHKGHLRPAPRSSGEGACKLQNPQPTIPPRGIPQHQRRQHQRRQRRSPVAIAAAAHPDIAGSRTASSSAAAATAHAMRTTTQGCLRTALIHTCEASIQLPHHRSDGSLARYHARLSLRLEAPATHVNRILRRVVSHSNHQCTNNIRTAPPPRSTICSVCKRPRRRRAGPGPYILFCGPCCCRGCQCLSGLLF